MKSREKSIGFHSVSGSGFAMPVTLTTSRAARPSELPGPTGETCGSCANASGVRHGSRTYYKCDLVKPTRGGGTDIRLKDPACSRFVKEQ